MRKSWICNGSIGHQPGSASKMDSGDQEYDQSFKQITWPQTTVDSSTLRGRRCTPRVEEWRRGIVLVCCGTVLRYGIEP